MKTATMHWIGCTLATAIAAFSLPGCGSEKHASESVAPDTEGEKEQGPEPTKLNVVFFLSDALRAASLPMYGYKKAVSPQLAMLAEQGLLFKHHHAAASYTRLSVSQMFTGLLSAPSLMASQHSTPIRRALEADVLVLPALLGEHGYHTTLISTHPWFNYPARSTGVFKEHTVLTAYASFSDMMPLIEASLDASVKRGGPFFLYIHSMDTHTPHQLHKAFSDHVGDGKVGRRYYKYDSEIRYTDHHVGLVIAALKARGLLETSIIVFTSDHGDEFLEMGSGWYNMTHGANLRRAILHVPLIIRFPESMELKGVVEDMTSHLDVAPTVARLAVPAADLSRYRFDGEDLSDRLRAKRFAGSGRTTFANKGRFMSMSLSDHPSVDLIYDRWYDRVIPYEHKVNEDNYPLPTAIEPDEQLKGWITKFEKIARGQTDRFRSFQLIPLKPASRKYWGTVVPSRTKHPPVFADTADDRWGIYPGRSVTAQPEEKPGAITLEIDVAPGRYKVGVALRKQAIDRGFKNGMRVALLGTDQKPMVFKAGGSEPVLDMGIHELEDHLQITIDQAVGGVSIAGFYLEYVGEAEEEKQEKIDPELTEQLRALGYVE